MVALLVLKAKKVQITANSAHSQTVYDIKTVSIQCTTSIYQDINYKVKTCQNFTYAIQGAKE